MELYQGWRGAVQLAAEVLLTATAALLAAHQMHLMIQAQRHEGSPLAFHTGGLDTLALLSTALLCTTLAIWWTFTHRAANFTMDLRFPVYTDMTADVFPMELADGGSGLVAAARAFERVDETVTLVSWYFALNGVHVLVLVVRLLHLMHFHPRLGIITRSLVVAMPDLFNFLLVGGASPQCAAMPATCHLLLICQPVDLAWLHMCFCPEAQYYPPHGEWIERLVKHRLALRRSRLSTSCGCEAQRQSDELSGAHKSQACPLQRTIGPGRTLSPSRLVLCGSDRTGVHLQRTRGHTAESCRGHCVHMMHGIGSPGGVRHFSRTAGSHHRIPKAGLALLGTNRARSAPPGFGSTRSIWQIWTPARRAQADPEAAVLCRGGVHGLCDDGPPHLWHGRHAVQDVP